MRPAPSAFRPEAGFVEVLRGCGHTMHGEYCFMTANTIFVHFSYVSPVSFLMGFNSFWVLSAKKGGHFLRKVVLANGNCLSVLERCLHYSGQARRKHFGKEVVPEEGNESQQPILSTPGEMGLIVKDVEGFLVTRPCSACKLRRKPLGETAPWSLFPAQTPLPALLHQLWSLPFHGPATTGSQLASLLGTPKGPY